MEILVLSGSASYRRAITLFGATNFTVAVLAITTSTIMGILVFTYTQKAAIAQYQNFTGSIRISPTLLQTIQSKASVTPTTAITNAERGVGSNSYAIFARLGVMNGFLVYIVNIIDANHSVHGILETPRSRINESG